MESHSRELMVYLTLYSITPVVFTGFSMLVRGLYWEVSEKGSRARRVVHHICSIRSLVWIGCFSGAYNALVCYYAKWPLYYSFIGLVVFSFLIHHSKIRDKQWNSFE